MCPQTDQARAWQDNYASRPQQLGGTRDTRAVHQVVEGAEETGLQMTQMFAATVLRIR